MKRLYLARGEERRIRAGHLWVFANEVDATRSPLGEFEPGELVDLMAHRGARVGLAYVNPHSLICARVLDRRARAGELPALLRRRLADAIALRERLYPAPYHRLVHGEGDLLPGLVVDRYGGHLVMQVNTAGMQRLTPLVLDALRELLEPASILLRNDSPYRDREGLPREVVPALGEPPEHTTLEEGGVRFRVPLAAGQKTGWFFDHRDNRARVMPLVTGRRVLDLYSYLGSWGLQAAAAGAREVVCVDSSRPACRAIAETARSNGLAARVVVRDRDVPAALEELREAGERFDVVILDPPALVPRRKDLRAGTEAYVRVNRAAAEVLGGDGLLVSASCSALLERQRFLDVLRRALHTDGRVAQRLWLGGQGADHPVHPAIPETDYLKCALLRVRRAQDSRAATTARHGGPRTTAAPAAARAAPPPSSPWPR